MKRAPKIDFSVKRNAMSPPVTFVPEETRSHRRGRLAIECLAELAMILRSGPLPAPMAEFGAIRHAHVPVRVTTGLKTAPESKRERRLRLLLECYRELIDEFRIETH